MYSTIMIPCGFAVVLPILFFATMSEARVHLPVKQGAVEAVPHSHPWLLDLRAPTRGVVCQAALISACENCNRSDMAIIAAHCVTMLADGKPTKIMIRQNWVKLFARTHKVLRYNEFDWLQPTSSMEKIILHPEWAVENCTHSPYDIAVVKLEEPFEFEARIQPIDLPDDDKPAPVGTPCKVAGWGSMENAEFPQKSEYLMEMNVTIVEDEACSKNMPNYNKQEMVCAASAVGGGSTACPGDSGMPLVCPNEAGRNTVYGLLSMGDADDCEGDVLPIYTNVASVAKWIRETVEQVSTVKN